MMNTKPLPENPTVEQERDYYKALSEEQDNDIKRFIKFLMELFEKFGYTPSKGFILGDVLKKLGPIIQDMMTAKMLGNTKALEKHRDLIDEKLLSEFITKYGGTQ